MDYERLLSGPWSISLGVLAIGAIGAFWREVGLRWEADRALRRLEAEHRHRLELQLLEAPAEEVDARAAAVVRIRLGGQADSSSDRTGEFAIISRDDGAEGSAVGVGSRLDTGNGGEPDRGGAGRRNPRRTNPDQRGRSGRAK